MTEQSRDARLLRILTSGPAGPHDWPDAKYLIDKGLGDGHVLLSHMGSGLVCDEVR